MDNTQGKLVGHINFYHQNLGKINGLSKLVKNAEERSAIIDESMMEEAKLYLHFSGFLNASFLDVALCIKGLYKPECDWDYIFYHKHGYLTIYEFIESYNSRQESLNESLRTKYPERIENYSEIARSIRLFKRKYSYESVIKPFRNEAGAHYHEDFNLYMDNLEKVYGSNIKNASSCLKEFSNLLMVLLTFWNDVIQDFVDRQSLS